jgi:hypothetical protein
MIKGLTGTQGVTVSGGNTALPFISTNVNNPIQGMLRINMTELEVFNGTGWQSLPSSYATVGLEPTAEEAIKWVMHKMQEEKDLQQRMEKHPGLKSAYEQFRIMDALTLEEEKHEQPA